MRNILFTLIIALASFCSCSTKNGSLPYGCAGVGVYTSTDKNTSDKLTVSKSDGNVLEFSIDKISKPSIHVKGVATRVDPLEGVSEDDEESIAELQDQIKYEYESEGEMFILWDNGEGIGYTVLHQNLKSYESKFYYFNDDRMPVWSAGTGTFESVNYDEDSSTALIITDIDSYKLEYTIDKRTFPTYHYEGVAYRVPADEIPEADAPLDMSPSVFDHSLVYRSYDDGEYRTFWDCGEDTYEVVYRCPRFRIYDTTIYEKYLSESESIVDDEIPLKYKMKSALMKLLERI